MMLKPVSRTISQKLTWMNILVCASALLVACLAFIVYDIANFRDAAVRNLGIQAQIIGFNSVSALTFNDPRSAQSTLSALSTSPNIISAGILTADGKLFARYARDANLQPISVPSLASGQEEAHWFTTDELLLVRLIAFQGRPVGTVYIRSNLQRLHTRVRQYLEIVLVVLMASFLAALLVSSVFRRAVATPIMNLAETSRLVSREKNYSLRVPRTGEHDEVATLIDAFNEMLAQIQQRDAALRSAQSQLEARVEERTRQLSAANKELEAFSYSVSHDLRAPLEVINGFSYVLQSEYAARMDNAGRECLQQVREATRRMSELIEDMLNLSRVSTSAMERQRVNLSALARSIAEELQRRQPERHVEFVIAEGVVVEGDSRFLQIVLENLLRNAWKYTSHHAQARIEFGSVQRRGEVIYFVSDDGAGFDPQKADRLFQPFQRLHSESEFSGNGIGLATVQRIVRRHAGQVWAQAAVEKGATFYFTIGPITAQSLQHTA